MAKKSFTRKCTSCQSKTTVVYAPTVEVLAGWGTEMVPTDHRTFVCAVCGKPLLAKALDAQTGKVPAKTEPAVPAPVQQGLGTGWGTSRRTMPRRGGWS